MKWGCTQQAPASCLAHHPQPGERAGSKGGTRVQACAGSNAGRNASETQCNATQPEQAGRASATAQSKYRKETPRPRDVKRAAMQAARTGGRRHAGRRANSATRMLVTTKASSARHGQRANHEHAAQGNNVTPHTTERKQSTKRAIPHILFIHSEPPPKAALLTITSSFLSVFFAFNPAGGSHGYRFITQRSASQLENVHHSARPKHHFLIRKPPPKAALLNISSFLHFF